VGSLDDYIDTNDSEYKQFINWYN